MTSFQIYKAEINRLLERTQTGGGWEISFTAKEDLDSALARCTYNVLARWVRFSFSPANNSHRNKPGIIKSAKHEFGHFVTARLERLAVSRFITEQEIDEESECIARIFERM